MVGAEHAHAGPDSNGLRKAFSAGSKGYTGRVHARHRAAVRGFKVPEGRLRRVLEETIAAGDPAAGSKPKDRKKLYESCMNRRWTDISFWARRTSATSFRHQDQRGIRPIRGGFVIGIRALSGNPLMACTAGRRWNRSRPSQMSGPSCAFVDRVIWVAMAWGLMSGIHQTGCEAWCQSITIANLSVIRLSLQIDAHDRAPLRLRRCVLRRSTSSRNPRAIAAFCQDLRLRRLGNIRRKFFNLSCFDC